MVECIREAGDRDVWKRRGQRAKCPNGHRMATGETWHGMTDVTISAVMRSDGSAVRMRIAKRPQPATETLFL